MKNKSTRHKSDNVFKFQPFSERIANLDINIFHRVGHEYETQTENETTCYFYQTIEKWTVLNLTEGYGTFKKEVKLGSNITLSQLIYNKEHVVQTLLKHLKHGDALYLQPLLEILVALVQDLQADFYQYYPNFLNVLIELLNTKDTEQLEWTFTCIAYIFKLLWRILIKDIDNVFNLLLPLLSDTKPEYINNFAAESFAFVARKVKDKRNFLVILLRTVRDTNDSISGSSRLLFEVINGVNGKFHSCAESWLSLYFELLEDHKHSLTLFQILEEVVSHITNNIYPQNSEVFWVIVIKSIQETLQSWAEKRNEKYLSQLLQCIGQAIEYRSGRFLLQPDQLISKLLKLYATEELPEHILLSASKIVILLLLSKTTQLQQEQASILIRTVLNVQSENVFLFFIENTFSYSSFEALILPSFLRYCVKCELNECSLRILAKLIQAKSPLVSGGINIDSWHKYALNFYTNANNNLIERILLDHITLNSSNMHCDQRNYIYSIICLPHIKYSIGVEEVLLNNIKNFCETIGEEKDIKDCLFLLLITFECAVHILEHSKLVNLQNILTKHILPLCENVEYITALKILDLFLTVTKEEMLKIENMVLINKNLERNFNSPYHEMRLYTTHIYSLFDEIWQQQDDNLPEKWNLFSLCYKTECITPHVHTYREQLIHLDKLHFDRPQITLCKNSEFDAIPLRYLCGVLYMNFKLLWDPVIKIIASHAVGMDMSRFWEIFVVELKTVLANITKDEKNEISRDFNCDLLDDLYTNAYKIDVKPDFSNYRLLLWKAMSLFPEIAEAKTRDVSTLFLDFINNEYMTSSADDALTWNIKQNDPIENTDLQEDDLEEIAKDESSTFPKVKGKYNLRTLIQHLQVFAKIRSAKSMYREPELYKLYLDLLSHKNSGVQKVALDCIMTYKFKYLTPYKDHLYNLIDEKKFKNEVVAFKVDQESEMIQESHRDELVPVIMKIVFSKMISKTGLRTGGKSSGQFRRSIIFRFLAGCRQNEMMKFIRMAFRYYNNYLSNNPVDMINKIYSSINLEKFIPPKRLQSSLNMINVVLEQFGALMGDELLSYLLNVILIIGVFIRAGFEQQNALHEGYIPLFRNLRKSCIKVVNRIFGLFENYPWTSEEINAIYDVLIWPYLKKLPFEGIHSPTALLQLLTTWGSYPRYFNLLVKHYDNDVQLHPLSTVISLLLNEKSHISVCNLILEMIEKLLTLQRDEDDVQKKITFSNELPICGDLRDKLKSKEAFNYGSCILLPHASDVLEKIKRKFQNKSKNLNQRELFILSRISELVWEADISDSLLELLLPIALKKCTQNASEEIILQLMTTLNNLLMNVKQPEKHLKYISPLFGEVNYPSSRKLLCQLIHIIAENVPGQFVLIHEIMMKMNAWDSKWVNQPDFQVRVDTFNQIQTLIAADALPLELGILLIYNCSNVLNNEKDLALKENASHCLKTVAPYLVNKYPKRLDSNYILDETLFTLIRSNLKSKNSDTRNEYILLLGCLARDCSDSHIVLKDLHKLTNRQDKEVDFFENLTHLQVHRHGRALLKFSNMYKEEVTLPNIRTLTQFVLPLTTHYLCNDKYVNKHSIIDAAIYAVGTICRLLPWHQYEGLLKFYLARLRRKDYQKQLVKLIVTILDSFHFDLKKGQLQEERKQELEMVLKNDTQLSTDIENNLQLPERPNEIEDIDPNNEEDVDEMEEILDNLETLEESDVAEEESSTTIETAIDSIKVYDKISVLCKSAATRVIKTIQVVLLPQLHKTLAQMTHYESSHKINRKKINSEREEEDLLRVPISLALVKLLQKLPTRILDSNLPGIFMKLCTFLKSQLESVRRAARETLQKIMTALGPSYLGLLLDEMIPLLSRGFQVHVLVYTVHSVLTSLRDMFREKDVDAVLITVTKLCNADLFGILAEEKEVNKIISKVSEAKASKSFDTYHILGQYITEKCLMDLILPIKEILSTSYTFKTVNKAQECLRHVALGLIENNFISAGALLKFSFGVASESIPELLTIDKPTLTDKEREKLGREKPDCFIIAKEPVYRSGHRTSNVKSSNKTNAHIMIEFGLRLCLLLLKREKIRDNEFKPFLDPFVPIFKNCLVSKNVKLSTITLQCLGWILKYELPSLKENIGEIANLLFDILHKYGAAGLSKGDNFDLVVAAFKVMTVLVRDVKYYIVETDQLKVLLLYVEQDLHDHDRQATAFSLLRAILSRKLITSELFDIMTKITELSITSELLHVRLQSRIVSHQFLMDYPLGKRLDKYISFYLAQLKYEAQTGRESAIEMIQTLINSFPMKVLKEYSGTFLITLGARLINDSDPSCRRLVAGCINCMFSRLSKSNRDPLFNIIKVWLGEKNVTHKRLAAQLCGILVTVEKASFETRISDLIPLLKSQFNAFSNDDQPGKFVRLRKEPEIDSEERINDHHLFQVLQLLLKIAAQCPAFLKQVEDIEDISKSAQQLLGYPHEWVRLSAAQFLGFVLSSIDIKELGELVVNNKSANGYLHSDPLNDIRSLSLDLCDQLQPNCVKEELAEQVVKNLVFIARTLQNVPFSNQNKINLLWLVKRMRKIINSEIVETSTSTILRAQVFKWIAGVATAVDLQNLEGILQHLLAPIVREMITTDENESSIRHLSKEVGLLIKKKVGIEKYTEIVSKLQQQLFVKRAERKRSRNQLAVTDPEIFAKKKIKHHEKKKEAKKRKISERKGSVKNFKRKKIVELDSSEIM